MRLVRHAMPGHIPKQIIISIFTIIDDNFFFFPIFDGVTLCDKGPLKLDVKDFKVFLFIQECNVLFY